MAAPKVVVVGAGPAGLRAAATLVAGGLSPILIDESATSGGQIYRRQPANFRRSYQKLYGFDADKAQAIHGVLDTLGGRIDYRPNTLVWQVGDGRLYTQSGERSDAVDFDALILATGATDRLAPIRGWTLPGCYSLGASQIALKAQACSIGRSVVFMGTGPLLYLIAYQYAKAGANVKAVLDTSAFSAQVRALPALASRPNLLLRGLYFRAVLIAKGVPVHNSVKPIEIMGPDHVSGVRVQLSDGKSKDIQTDAVGMGFHLRSETQLADLAGCGFEFDNLTQQWQPRCDEDGRTDRPGVYIAGDGARILGADAAETAGQLAAFAALTDLGLPSPSLAPTRLRRQMAVFRRFRSGLMTAFPWPKTLVKSLADDVLICRCEAITVGNLRQASVEKGAPELNRAKALSRVGMGRCQGRYCGSAAAEVLASAEGKPLASAGRIRGQAPVKPLSIALSGLDT